VREGISSGAMSAGEIRSGRGYYARTTLPAFEARATTGDHSNSGSVRDSSRNSLRRSP
jgi:hypothetical protein